MSQQPPKITPPMIWAGLGIAALFFGKQLVAVVGKFLAGWNPKSTITPTDEPVLPALETSALRASFIEPANNGHLWSWQLAIRMKVQINNPNEAARDTELKVSVTWYPRTFYGGSPTATQAALQLKVPPGRSTHEVKLSRPLTIAFSDLDAVGAVEIDGRQTSSVAFTVD